MNRELTVGNIKIGGTAPVFFIAEIGQNHQGCIETAKRLIDAAKDSGAHCVKFQKTDLNDKFTESVLKTPYDKTEHSWGKTYGEHKQFLEFTEDQFVELQKYAKEKNILFAASPMDFNSLEFLLKIDVPFLKIGSGDFDNMIMLQRAAKSGKPLIMSTGMQTWDSVQFIYRTMKSMGAKFAFLHCVSCYPTPMDDVNLKVIQRYKEAFPDTVVGYSGHEIGYNATLGAVALGAKIIERHFTFDHNQKGSDHQCSLTPDEFKQMVFQATEIESALGSSEKQLWICELECWRKLGKTIVAAHYLGAGKIIEESDVKIKVASTKGMEPLKYRVIMGRKLKRSLNKDDPLMDTDVE